MTENVYTINITNNSGTNQTYGTFSNYPVVNNNVNNPQIWSNVFATANTPNGENAKFQIYEQWTAQICTSSGSPQQGVEVNVTGTEQVTLGYIDDNTGNQVPGSSVELVVPQANFPQFSNASLTPDGDQGAFNFTTSDQFTVQDAKNGNWMIGIGGSPNGSSTAPTALFIPSPGTSYQIEPIVQFYVSAGNYAANTLVNVQAVSTTKVLVNFSALGTDQVNILHSPNGNLVIESSTPSARMARANKSGGIKGRSGMALKA
jgi:hypothetical protein